MLGPKVILLGRPEATQPLRPAVSGILFEMEEQARARRVVWGLAGPLSKLLQIAAAWLVIAGLRAIASTIKGGSSVQKLSRASSQVVSRAPSMPKLET